MNTKEYIITEENRYALCDEIAEAVEEFCSKYIKSDHKEILRYRLTIEECMLEWFDEDSYGKKFVFTCGKNRFKAPEIKLEFDGAAKNPFVKAKDENFGVFGESTMRTLGLSPVYSYKDGWNSLSFSVKKEGMNGLLRLVFVFAAAAVVGLLGPVLIPEKIMASLLDIVINPVYDTFFGVLTTIAGPMIFLSVTWGIYGIGDASSLSKIGKKVMFHFLRNDFLVVIFGVAFIPILGLKVMGGSAGGSEASSIMQLILGIFPKNIIEPFESGNTLQIIVLAFAVGIALIYMGKKTQAVARAIEEINYMLQFLMNFIGKLVPFMVFVVIVSLFWSGSFGIVAETWKLILALLVGFFVTILVFTAYTAWKQQISVFKIMKKCTPSFFVALFTASSAAAFNSNMEICKKKLGVKDTISSFGIPLGMVMNNPIAALNNLVVIIFFAVQYELECSVSWVIIAVIVSAIVAIASPPIPGGGTIAYTLLFAQMGLPSEALAIALAVDLLTDFVITASEMYCLLPALVNAAAATDMLDRRILEKE